MHKKIGLLVPSSNTTVEYDFQCTVPVGVSLHAARLWSIGSGAEAAANMNADLETAVRYIASARPDFIVYACTGGSLVEGPGYDLKITRRIVEIAGGIPALTVSTAVKAALATLGLKKLSVVTPYQDSMTALVGQYLEGSGYQVVALAGRHMPDNLAVGNDPPDDIIAFAKANLAPDADGIFLSCTNWRAMMVAERIERETGKLVVTANQAIVWATLHALGFDRPVSGYGQLMARRPVRLELTA